MKWVDQIYEGEWKNDQIHGYGRYIFPSSTQQKLKEFFIGEFSENLKNGFGIHFYSDSSLLMGNWVNDKKEG